MLASTKSSPLLLPLNARRVPSYQSITQMTAACPSSVKEAAEVAPEQRLLSSRATTALVLLGWQLLSAALACTSILSQLLSDHHFDAPLIQSFGNYLLLTMIFVPWRYSRPTPGLPWYFYLMIAIADVEGNYFVVLAYQYTDIASATLLDCFTIPCVVLLSILILKTQYNRRYQLALALTALRSH